MPNHCNNTLTIKSDDTGFLQSLMNELKMDDSDNPKFLEKLVPFTADINYDWDYNWCVQHWGTKWDIFDVTYASLDGDTLEVSFATAWSPPIEALVTGMLQHGYTFDLYYEEGGVGFIGHTEGDGESHIDQCWETYTDADPSTYIPEDVLDAFPWVESDWRDWQREQAEEGREGNKWDNIIEDLTDA